MTSEQKLQINRQARKVGGKINALVCIQTNGIDMKKVRSLINEAYIDLDNLLELIDGFGKE